jgi:hypothetical protein
MKLGEWIGDAVWLHEDEREWAVRLVDAFEHSFDDFGMLRTPLLALRTEDVVVLRLLVRRLENRLAEPAEETSPKRGTDDPLEAVGKARDRLRKAMKELEELYPKSALSAGAGLADIMKPILKQADGVIEDALAFETKKRSRSRSTEQHAAEITPDEESV